MLNGNGNLNGTELDGTGGGTLLVEPQFPIPVGAEFVIISKLPNPRLDTRFLGLPEGDFLDVGNVVMNISYVASDRGRGDSHNNDVVLTAPGRYDFNGFGGHTETDLHAPCRRSRRIRPAYGRLGRDVLPCYFERYSASDPGWDKLRYDGQSTNPMGDPLTFRVNVLAGKTYEVMILTGDASWNHDRESFKVVGSAVGDVHHHLARGQRVGRRGPGRQRRAGHLGRRQAQHEHGLLPLGPLDHHRRRHARHGRHDHLTMDDLGGGSGSTVILAMDIRPVDTVGDTDRGTRRPGRYAALDYLCLRTA